MNELEHIYHSLVLVWPIFALFAVMTLYWWPTLMAFYKMHPFPLSVAFLNFVIGWTVIGWIFLAWRMKTWQRAW